MADLTTLTNVKQWLSVTDTSDDALLSRLISAGSDYIQTWLNRTFAIQSYTETRSGTGGSGMAVKNYPVTAVTSVQVDGLTIPQVQGAVDYGWWLNEPATMVYLRGSYFSRGIGNVTLAYQAGYNTTPNEIEQACIELVGLRYKERDRIGVTSKTLAGEVISFTQKDFTDAIQTTLTNYKRVVSL